MRYLLTAAAAAALLTTSAVAHEAVKTRVTTITFDDGCNTFSYTLDPVQKKYASIHSNGCAPQGKPIPGIGVVIKKNPGGSAARQIAVGETINNDDGSQDGYVYGVDYPLVTGGQWILYDTKDGSTITQAATGTYTVSK